MKNVILILFLFGVLFSSIFPINDTSAALGDITAVKTQSLGNNLEYGAMGKHTSLVQVDADTYALAYSGADEDGFISTFTISSDGSTTLAEVESLEHDTANGEFNSLVHVVGDTYALAYSGADEDGDDSGDGFISTFDIDSGGDITPIKVANHVELGEGSSVNLEHDATRGEYNSMVQVDADTYALAYSGADEDGFISTFTISADGSTTLAEVESIEHDAALGKYNSLVHVVGDTYALAYEGGGNDGFISTFDIDSGGDTTPIKVANHVELGEGSSVNLEYDGKGKYTSLVQVDADTYALAYSGGGDDGFISTFTISADGSTTLAEVESIEHDAARGQSNSLVHVVGDTYALAYEGDDNDGFISTFDIDSGGDITPIKVANHVELGEGSSVNLEHDTEYNKFNSLVHVVGDTCALAYSDTTNGDISTFTIDITPVAEETKKSGSDCYDCEPPKLQQAQIQIASAQKIIATDDDPIHITANVGDKVMVILNVTDNKSVDTFRFAGLYTNYQEKPSDMNAFYANNYDKWKHISTSFYEWNVRADDVAYDYDGTVSWSDNAPTVVTDVITDENYFMKNDDNTLEYFMMPFTFTMNDSMETSQITAKIYDASGNRLYETLPVTLEIISKEIVVLSDAEEIATLDKGDVIVIPSEDTTPLLNEPVLFTVLSQWSGYSQVTSDDAEMLSVIGLQGDSLPAWTKNLGEWVIQEKLDVSELIMAINYVHNNQ